MNLQDKSIDTEYDVIIIGGAAAGLSAALYAARRTLKTLIITTTLGGQATLAEIIENYPGIERINGYELMDRFLGHAKKHGAECVFETARSLRKEGDGFFITTTSATYTARAVILAFGLTPRSMNVSGEAELQGKGVCYCATCDAPLYKEKRVAVVGGTFEALDAALLLSRLECAVHFVHDKENLATHPELFEQLQQNPRVTMHMQTTVVRVAGRNRVEGLVVRDASANEETIAVDGIFVEKGYHIDATWLGDLVELNARHAIVVNEEHETKTAGLFAAGDVTPLRDKQVVISAGSGAAAALSSYRYIQKQQGKPVTRVDWEHT